MPAHRRRRPVDGPLSINLSTEELGVSIVLLLVLKWRLAGRCVGLMEKRNR